MTNTATMKVIKKVFILQLEQTDLIEKGLILNINLINT